MHKSSADSDRYRGITSEEFAERLTAVDYNSRLSIPLFWESLNIPNHKRIIFGTVRDKEIALFPQSGVLDPHSEIDGTQDDVNDTQEMDDGQETADGEDTDD